MKKKINILALTVSAIVIIVMTWIAPALFRGRYSKWISDILFFQWGWILVIGLAGYALKETRNCNFTFKILNPLTIILNTITLVLALVWLLLVLYMASFQS